MTPEGKVKEQVKKLLKAYGAYYHMPVQNGMGSPTLDFICCLNGRYIAIETKAPGKLATVRQQKTMEEICVAGGTALVIDGSAEHLRQLQDWLIYVTTTDKLSAP
jgi:hypothetical protein